MSFVDSLFGLAEARGYPPLVLAKRVGCYHQQLYRWRSRKTLMRLRYMDEILQAARLEVRLEKRHGPS